jgi:hypothetical protein
MTSLVNDCVCGTSCALKLKCDTQHACYVCKGFMHAICGHPRPETDPDWSIKYSRICNNCHASDNITLAQLGKRAAPTADPTPAPAPKPAPKKRKKKKARPDATYEEDPSADPSNWNFPWDRPEYLSTFLEFMSFVESKEHTKESTFTKEQLIRLQPKHVLAFLTHKAFGSTTRKPEDKPEYARSNHIKNIKMKLSYYMPSGAPWVDLPNGKGHGNPTCHNQSTS